MAHGFAEIGHAAPNHKAPQGPGDQGKAGAGNQGAGEEIIQHCFLPAWDRVRVSTVLRCGRASRPMMLFPAVVMVVVMVMIMVVPMIGSDAAVGSMHVVMAVAINGNGFGCPCAK